MEIRTPALHSVLGRGFLCLSPPPSPQLLSSYFIATIWCLLTAVSSPLQAPHSTPRLPCTVPLAQPNIAHFILPALSPLSHPSSHPYSFTHPFPVPRLGPVSYQPLFISTPTAQEVSIPLLLIPPPLWLPCLFSLHSHWLFAGLLIQIRPPLLPSLSSCSHRKEPAGCKVSVAHPPPRSSSREFLTWTNSSVFCIFLFSERVEPFLQKIPKFTFREIKFRSALVQTVELRKNYWQQKRGFLHKKIDTAIYTHNH